MVRRGAHAQDLLHDRVEVGGIALAQARVDVRVAREPLERPGQRGRRGVVPGREQGHELVAQVPVGRRVAAARRAARAAGRASSRRRARPAGAPPRPSSSSSKRSTASRKRPQGLRGPRSRCTSDMASIRGIERTVSSVPWTASRSCAASCSPRAPKTIRRMVSSVRCFIRSSVITRPLHVLSSAPGELGDGGPERAHALPVERGLDEPPLAQVLLAVEHEDRVRPGEGAQELPALAGGRDRRVEPEDLAHRVRVGEEHERLVHPVGPDGDRVAEALVNAPKERRGPHCPPHGLPGGGGARAGRQVHAPEATRPEGGEARAGACQRVHGDGSKPTTR